MPNNNPPRYTPQQVAEALYKTGGVVLRAARKLKCSARTIYNYLDKYPALRDSLKDARKDTYAMADEGLVAMAENPDHKDHKWAIQRLLQLYSNSVDDGVDHTDDDTSTAGGVTVTVNYPSDIPDPD